MPDESCSFLTSAMGNIPFPDEKTSISPKTIDSRTLVRGSFTRIVNTPYQVENAALARRSLNRIGNVESAESVMLINSCNA